VQDRDGGVVLMSTLLGLCPFLLKLYANSGYQGPKFQQALRCVRSQINVEIVKRSDVSEFVVLPERWIVEQTIAWLSHCRRLAKGLGMPQSNRSRIPALGLRPADAPKAMPDILMIPDGLSGYTPTLEIECLPDCVRICIALFFGWLYASRSFAPLVPRVKNCSIHAVDLLIVDKCPDLGEMSFKPSRAGIYYVRPLGERGYF
jgi:hypothetical protein